ncbi:hypothetical protein CDAR_594611 [Caerostris darwini]|uniref:Uncharacterized protein n=1 Tax=Caerostris darwini TaxID=1538125 RepID=A0AAV4WVV7_9ARAC|nr:hypothetical protein CDAR_594611 [Caerostris darwini]
MRPEALLGASYLDSHQLCFAERKQRYVAGAPVLDCFLLRDPQIARMVSQDEHPNVTIERKEDEPHGLPPCTMRERCPAYSTGARVTIAVKDLRRHFAVVFSCHK